jgi:beta-lactamase class A
MPHLDRMTVGIAALLAVAALAVGVLLDLSFTGFWQTESSTPAVGADQQPPASPTVPPSPPPSPTHTVTATQILTNTATVQPSPLPPSPTLAAISTPITPPTALPASATSTSEPTAAPAALRYVFPVRGSCAPYQPYHHDYPATDIFCDPGSEFVAPTSGVIDFVNAVDRWDPATNVPADRGGIMVAMIGDDGVRYYGSHLSGVAEGIVVSARVEAGQVLGWTGSSGNAASTPPHLHFGISRPTFPEDWQTRRGEVPPYEYLQAWERGEMITPVLPAPPATATPTAAPTLPPPTAAPTLPPPTAAPTLPPPTAAPAPDLTTRLDALFNQSAGTFGVIVADPVSNTQQYARNAHVVFPAASLIKIPIAVTVYQAASQGSISLDTALTMDASVIVGGTGTIQYDPPGSSYTVRELVARMLYDSDNTAANMLIDHLGGFAPVNQTMQQVGATQTILQRRMMDFEARAAGRDNLTTPADMALLLQRLYQGALPDAAGAQDIINALAQTTDRQKIPAQLPPTVVVAHKIGVLPQVEHDAGIVLVPGQPYVLVVMSQGLASNAAGISTIATASRVVYDATVGGP